MKKNTIFKYCASLALGLALSAELEASYEIETIAGTGTAGSSGDGGLATSARLSAPRDVCVDSSGNIYIADFDNGLIRMAYNSGTVLGSTSYTSGNIYTIAGGGGTIGDGEPATSAQLDGPTALWVDSARNIYIADQGNNLLRMVAANSGTYYGVSFAAAGEINTIAGGGANSDISYNGLATGAAFPGNSPAGIYVDSSSNIFIADQGNNCIRMLWGAATNGTYTQNHIYTIAGTGSPGHSGDGGLASSAELSGPQNVFGDASGNIYSADFQGNYIRMFTVGGNISTIAGNGSSGYSGDGGPATSAAINPFSVHVDNLGSVYIPDWENNRVRKFTVGGNISTIAGNGSSGYSGDGGPATSAKLNVVGGVCVDSSGNVYLADTNNNRIRKLLPPSITLEVDGADSATVSADLAATTVHKTGTGASVLSGNNSGVSILAVDAGLVQVAATNNIGRSVTFAGGNMEITSGTVAVPTAAVNAAATITTNASAAVSSIAAPSGTSLLTIAGPGVVTAGDMSASYTPLSILGVMHVGSSSASKMTSGSAVVPSGGLVKIMGATASSVPGATEIQSGAILEVAASVAVPADTGADIFGTLKFNSGSKLKLGAGSTWARNMAIGTAL